MDGLNKTTFYAYLRRLPFGGRLTQSQIDGVDSIVNAFTLSGAADMRWLAYMLATVFHETGGRMIPVREGFALTDGGARKIVAAREYGKVDPVTNQVYYGRGLVQLTWNYNYEKIGQALGLPLYSQPDLALIPATAAVILVQGMIRGMFTGKGLAEFFNPALADPMNARRIINGTDKADLISHYYNNFLSAITEAQATGTAAPDDVQPQAAMADHPNLLTDPTTMGTISAVASSGALGSLSSIQSPWVFLALGALVICLVLFATGRLQIVHKAGA